MTKSQKPGPSEPDAPSLRIRTSDEISRGVYANLAVVRHTQLEFILDFLLAIDSDAQLVSRVVLSPDHAKRLKAALEQNLAKHASSFPSSPSGSEA